MTALKPARMQRVLLAVTLTTCLVACVIAQKEKKAPKEDRVNLPNIKVLTPRSAEAKSVGAPEAAATNAATSTANYYCTSDSQCQLYYGGGTCTPQGYCVKGGFGDPCVNGGDCQNGLCSQFFAICVKYCYECQITPNSAGAAPPQGGNFCWDNWCYPQQPVGGSCRQNSDCISNSCSSSQKCVQQCGCPGCPACPNGFWCNGNKCDDKRPDGSSCTTSDQCDSGMCYYGKCGYYNRPNGASCTSSQQCTSQYCNPATGVCSQQGCTVPCPGCGPTCPSGYWCSSGQCKQQNPNGQPCSSSAACISGYCNPTTGLCAAQPTSCGCPGCPLCPSGTYCNFINQCVPKVPNGQSCGSSSQCISGYCTNGICSTPGQYCCPGCPPCPAGQTCLNSYCTATGPQQCGCPGCPTCASGLFCGTSNVCTPQLPNNANCQANNWCLSGYCDSVSKKCGACSGSANSCPDPRYYCAYTSQANNYQCLPKKSGGNFCGASWECLSNVCTANACTY